MATLAYMAANWHINSYKYIYRYRCSDILQHA